MADNVLTAIYIALLISPYISIIAIVPFLMRQYRNEKVIRIDKSVGFYLLMISWLSAFFMTMLPFPSHEALKYMNVERVQLIPFHAVYAYFTQNVYIIAGSGSALAFLGNWNLLSPLFNVVMLLPLGYFSRVTFDLKFSKTILYAFLSSLFFEVTQLTGIFFIYPQPYRTFDVDDIITNVMGAALGWLIVPLLNRISFLNRLKISGSAIRQGGDVSLRRRIPAILTDQLIIVVIVTLLSIPVNMSWTLKFPIFFAVFILTAGLYGIVIYRCGGSSAGYALTGLKLKSMVGDRLSPRQCIMRSELLGATFSIPLWMGYLLNLCALSSSLGRIVFVCFNVLITIFYTGIIFSFLLNGLTHGSVLFYDRICKTYLGLSERSKNTDGLVLIADMVLNAENISLFSEYISAFLEQKGADHRAALRVALLADGKMNDWLKEGLSGNMCELKFDNRMWHKTLFLSVFAPNDNIIPDALSASGADESYVDMLAGVRLSYETFYTGISYTIAIDLP